MIRLISNQTHLFDINEHAYTRDVSVAHVLSYSFKDRPGFYVFNWVNRATGNSNQLTC